MGVETWTKADATFLRSLRVAWSGPPPPLPRFRVEPSAVDDEGYRVIDTWRKFRSVVECGPKEFKDPRAAAEDVARQMNEH